MWKPLIAAVAVATTMGCTTLESVGLKRPGVALQTVKLGKISLTAVQLDLGLKVTNPNAFALNLAGVEYSASGLGMTLGSGATTEPIQLAANGEQVVTLPLSLTPQAALKFAQSYYGTASQLPIDLSATIKFDTPLGPLPLSFNETKDLKAQSKQ